MNYPYVPERTIWLEPDEETGDTICNKPECDTLFYAEDGEIDDEYGLICPYCVKEIMDAIVGYDDEMV